MQPTVKINDLIAKTFCPVMEDILDEKHTDYWLKGGRSSTKSSFISLMLVLGLLMDSDANAIVYRRVGNTIKDSVYAQMIWAIDALGWTKMFAYRKSPYEIILKKTGQRILFRGADDPAKSKSIKLNHGYFKFLWFEELTEFRGSEDIRSIKQSVFRGVRRGVTFYSYNPPKTANTWTTNALLEDGHTERLVHHSTYLDVPPEWLNESFIALAETVKNTNERAYRNEYLGEITGTGGQVFDNLEIREITDDEIKTFGRFYNGLDFGFAVDPDAFVRVAFVPNTRKLYIVDEYYSSHTPAETLKRNVTALAGRELVTCDNADPRMIAELRSSGLNAIAAKKGPGSRDHGYRWLQNLGAIVADPKRTPNAVRELQAYEYLRDKNDNFCAAYPDGNDHCLTGDTIVNTTNGGIRIDQLIGKTGTVYCYDEQEKQAATACFFDVRQTGIEEIFETELEDGRTIKASGEHPVLTRRGWVLARDLVEYDEILEVQISAPEAAPTATVRHVSITAIRRLPPEPVYNMEVEQHHNFAVNGGLIVHNCLDAIRYATESLSANRVAKTSNF